MLSTYQQGWEYGASRNRQIKNSRLHPQQQLLNRQQQQQQQQQGQNNIYGEQQQINHHMQQQQNYLNKIERAREQDEKQQERQSLGGTGRLHLLQNAEERQVAGGRQFETLKSTLQVFTFRRLDLIN